MNAVDTLALSDYVLHLADNALVLGQRNAEWCGHGPILEEDLALANNALDLIGQARLLYQYAAALQGEGASEDALAYFRDASQFRNYTLLELPHSTALAPTARGERDYAVTIVRNFLYSALMVLGWEQLQTSGDAQLAAIGAKSLKEARYHLRHARDWLVRFGDGSAESHARAQAALDFLLPYTMEFWTATEVESAAFAANIALDLAAARPHWEALVRDAVLEATLTLSPTQGFVPTGKLGMHSEHLSFLLAEMQSLARQHPGAQW